MAASSIPPAPQQSPWRGVGSICWITVLGTLIYIWRPEIIDGCDISCLLIWQEMFSFHQPCLEKMMTDIYTTITSETLRRRGRVSF